MSVPIQSNISYQIQKPKIVHFHRAPSHRERERERAEMALTTGLPSSKFHFHLNSNSLKFHQFRRQRSLLPIIRASSSRSSARTTTANNPPSAVKWSVDSWKTKTAHQLPEYPDPLDLESVLKTLESFPPIVFAGEARTLEDRLAQAAMGNAFLLQGGDCAESFKEFNANNIRDTFRVILQMSVVLMFGGQMPVIKVKFACSV